MVSLEMQEYEEEERRDMEYTFAHGTNAWHLPRGRGMAVYKRLQTQRIAVFGPTNSGKSEWISKNSFGQKEVGRNSIEFLQSNWGAWIPKNPFDQKSFPYPEVGWKSIEFRQTAMRGMDQRCYDRGDCIFYEFWLATNNTLSFPGIFSQVFFFCDNLDEKSIEMGKSVIKAYPKCVWVWTKCDKGELWGAPDMGVDTYFVSNQMTKELYLAPLTNTNK